MASSQGMSLASKFQGAIVGAVFGDCLGAKFEYFWGPMPNKPVVKYYETLINEVRSQKDGEKGFVFYTDDTCMTFDLGESLVKCKEFVPRDVARNFGETYFAAPSQRYYGANVGFIFRSTKVNDYRNPFNPAKEQFNGSGSYGNGSAMRVSPVPLFHHKDKVKIAELASHQSKLTHTNPKGINGAILQALAIEKAMTTEGIRDSVSFARELMTDLENVTTTKEELDVYDEKMKIVIKLIEQKTEVKAEDVINGGIKTDVTAHEAVPAAIFCFLYTLNEKNIPELSKFNGLVRAVIYAAAISLDSDTVASMAGAIAGAYYGIEMIPPEWIEACEGSDRALKLADDLYKLNKNNKEAV
uniref:ADP-ribose glycohydrolase ARH3-like n=1 Tax=Styela clava TaxID=7725 RepID=UPI001939F995|nr:ADP-ribose glycohydrolase ARH3-like [Styela clava]